MQISEAVAVEKLPSRRISTSQFIRSHLPRRLTLAGWGRRGASSRSQRTREPGSGALVSAAARGPVAPGGGLRAHVRQRVHWEAWPRRGATPGQLL